jgi:pimeloyl-[acyl-carrier protein] methyl ester esterase
MASFTTTTGVSLFYEDGGAGRPLVLIHGWAMSGKVWCFQEELARDYRLITIDLRGHGNSSSPDNGFSLELLARDVIDLVNHLQLRDAVLTGWSMGAQVALQACSLLRERLSGLVLVGGTPRFAAAADYPHGLPPEEVRGMALRLRRDYRKTMGDFFRGMFAPGEPDHDQYQRIVHQVVMGGRSPDPVAAGRFLEILGQADLRPLLPAIDLPVLLVHGSEDTICLPGASRYMAEQLPRAILRMIEGSGHAPFMARPAEFNRVLVEFLTALPQTGAM